MTKKQFALILAVWVAIMLLIFSTPAKSADIGMVQTTGAVTCEGAKGDLLAVSIRMHKLKDEFAAEENPHLRFVMKQQAQSLVNLGNVIIMWMKENCRDT